MFRRGLHTLATKEVVELAYSHSGGKPAKSHTLPAIIAIHGLLGAKAHFKPLTRMLASDLDTDIYSIDLRNHGDSPMARPYDYITHTKDVINFIRTKIGPERPVQMIGFSLGGKISLISALSDKVNVRSCTSIDIPPYETPELDDILTVNYETILKIINGENGYQIKKGEPNWQGKVMNLLRANKCNTNEGIVRYFAAGFVMNKVNKEKKDEFLDFKQPLNEMPDLLDQVKAWPTKEELEANGFKYQTQTPILFCKATESPFIKRDYSLLGRQFPNYTVEEFNTSHNIAHEAPEQFYKALLTFIKAHE